MAKKKCTWLFAAINRSQRNARPVMLRIVALFLGIQHPGVHQVGDLFDYGQRVSDAAYPEIFPQAVNFTF